MIFTMCPSLWGTLWSLAAPAAVTAQMVVVVTMETAAGSRTTHFRCKPRRDTSRSLVELQNEIRWLEK